MLVVIDCGTYYTFPIFSQREIFDVAIREVEAGQRPYKDKIFDILDDLVKYV